jgi:HEAT repeat protein
MAIPRIRLRWRLRTLMILVVLCATGLMAYRVYLERSPVYQLIRQLRTGNAQARSQAASQIGLMGPKAAFAAWALTSALDDPDRGVRVEAMYAMVRIGSRSRQLLAVLVAKIEEWPPSFHRGTRRWAKATGLLDADDPLAALQVIRPPAAVIVPMLGKALKSPNPWVRRRALDALLTVASWSDPSSPELAEALLARLTDDRFGSRQRTAESLAKLDRGAQERAVARLAHDLRDLESARAFEAAVLLPLFADGTRTAVATLSEQARGGDVRRKLIAPLLLAQYGELATPAAPTLVRLITERDADRRINLVLTFDWEETGYRSGGGYDLFRRMYPNLGDPGETSVVALGVRALRAMGDAAERRAIRDLIAMLQNPDQDDDLKCRAITGLREFGPEMAEAALRAATNDRSRRVRDHASAALHATTGSQARR